MDFNKCDIENINKIRKRKIVLIVILVVIIIGFIAFIFVDDYLWTKKAEKQIGSKMNETFEYSENKSMDNSVPEAQKCYDLLSKKCDLYMSNDTLTDTQKHDLTLILYELHDTIQKDILDDYSSISKYDNNDMLYDFNDKLLEDLNGITNRIENLWNKMNNSETITESEKEQFDEDFKYLNEFIPK